MRRFFKEKYSILFIGSFNCRDSEEKYGAVETGKNMIVLENTLLLMEYKLFWYE